jgi:hypothetical protein
LRCPFGQRGADDDAVETGRLGRSETGGVGVVREAEDGDLGIRLGDLFRVDAREIDDDELGRIDAVGRDQFVSRIVATRGSVPS